MIRGSAADIAPPAEAQDGNVAIAYFVTTDLANLERMEDGFRGHVGWHATQNDPWPSFVYEAMTGGPEYVWVSPGHMWADFDSPRPDEEARRSSWHASTRAGASAAQQQV